MSILSHGMFMSLTIRRDKQAMSFVWYRARTSRRWCPERQGEHDTSHTRSRQGDARRTACRHVFRTVCKLLWDLAAVLRSVLVRFHQYPKLSPYR